LRVITGCTSDTETQHLHDETSTLPLQQHLTLHASQLKQKSQLPTHPLHAISQNITPPRPMKQTIFHNWKYPMINIPSDPILTTNDTISQNMKTIHTTIVQNYLTHRLPNKVLKQTPPVINKSEETLPRQTRRTLAQLRTNRSPFLMTYLNKINPTKYPNPKCPLCLTEDHDTQHLFSCTSIKTILKPVDLWSNPVDVADLLQLWKDALGAAGGGV